MRLDRTMSKMKVKKLLWFSDCPGCAVSARHLPTLFSIFGASTLLIEFVVWGWREATKGQCRERERGKNRRRQIHREGERQKERESAYNMF